MIQALIERLKRETENGHNLMYLIDQENNRRQTPLFLAVAANDPGKVQLLIKEGGANVNTLAQVHINLCITRFVITLFMI